MTAFIGLCTFIFLIPFGNTIRTSLTPFHIFDRILSSHKGNHCNYYPCHSPCLAATLNKLWTVVKLFATYEQVEETQYQHSLRDINKF